MLLTELGMDSLDFRTSNGVENQTMQADVITSLWKLIDEGTRDQICAGGVVFEYVDEVCLLTLQCQGQACTFKMYVRTNTL